MPFGRPRRLDAFDYAGVHRYHVRIATWNRVRHFADREVACMVRERLLTCAATYDLAIHAYCFMPDHVHLLVEGLTDTADCKRFISAAKQYSGYSFAQREHQKLWQRYSYEHALRDDFERSTTIRYILDNPVTAGLVSQPSNYPFLGSQRYSIEELLQQASPSSSG